MNAENFLDTRTHGFVRVAATRPEVHIANPRKNAESHVRLLKRAWEEGASYALCPELGLAGYTCGDHFRQLVLLEATKTALQELVEKTASLNLLATVGMPLEVDGALYNVAVTFAGGKLLAVVPKTYPPNYAEFYELRDFARSTELKRDTVRLLEQEVPIGTDILVSSEENPRFVLFTEICEDGWVPIPPSAHAALAGATIIANLSASNSTIAKAEYRRDVVTVGASGTLIAAVLYASAGFGESTNDLAWDGHAIIAERGELLSESKRFQMEEGIIVADVDLQTIIHDRMRQTSFHENAADNGRAFRRVGFKTQGNDPSSETFRALKRTVNSHPFVPSDPAKRTERCEEIANIQTMGIVRRLASLPEKQGRRIVVGISGGLDSTLALLQAARAMDTMGMPRSQITAITMPGFGTTERTRGNARALAEALGVTLREISISKPVLEVFKAIGHDPEVENVTFENTQAWMRKLIELALASKVQAIDLGTGDLSELVLGWCTMYGDHASHYNPNGSVPKTLIFYLVQWFADVVFNGEPRVQNVLRDILTTPISPELKRPNKEGTIAQKTEEEIGPYELHDFFAYHFLRLGRPPLTIARLCYEAFKDKYSLEEIKRWLRVFLVRFFANQYKRDTSAPGPKVGSVSVSPRGDLRLPSEAEVDIWLESLDQVPDTL